MNRTLIPHPELGKIAALGTISPISIKFDEKEQADARTIFFGNGSVTIIP